MRRATRLPHKRYAEPQKTSVRSIMSGLDEKNHFMTSYLNRSKLNVHEQNQKLTRRREKQIDAYNRR